MSEAKTANDPNRCQGYIRRGGFMTLGPVTWHQCENKGIAMLTVKASSKVTTEKGRKTATMPACAECWQRCINDGIKIMKAVPIK